MNIAQLSEQLKDVPQNRLIDYARNPNSVVPQFLALAEIQRRQQLSAQVAPPTATVAEDVLAQAQPAPQMMLQQVAPQGIAAIPQQPNAQQMAQQLPENQPGVAQLPTGMPQGMASGGIVALASGDLIDDDTEEDREMAQLFPESTISLEDWQALAEKAKSGFGSLVSRLPQSYEKTLAATQKSSANPNIDPDIAAAASKHNIPAEYLNRVAGIESGGDPGAANRLSSSKGLLGFTDKTWAAMGGKPGEQINKAKSADLGGELSRKNAEGLKAHFGRNPTFGETYTAHHFGLSGAKHLLSLDPETPMTKAVSPLVIKQNPYLKNKTVGEVLSGISSKLGEGIVSLRSGGHIPSYSGVGEDESLVQDVPQVRAGNKLLEDYLDEDAEKNAAYKADIARENARLLEKAPAPSARELARQQLGVEATGIPRLLRNANKSFTGSLSQYQPNITAPENSVNTGVSLRDKLAEYIPSSSGPSILDKIKNYMYADEQSKILSNAQAGRLPSTTSAPNLISQGSVANREAYRNAPAVAPSVEERPVAAATAAPATPGAAPAAPGSAPSPTTIAQYGAPPAKTKSELLEEQMAANLEKQVVELAKQGKVNLAMSVLQAGLGMMASKSPYALGGIGEGGQQGVSTYASLKKQEADQLKDINAMRLGMYKYGAAKEAAQERNRLDQARLDALINKNESGVDIKNLGLFEKAYEHEANSIDKRALAHAKALGLETLPVELQQQYEDQKRQARMQLRKSYNLPEEPTVQYKPITSAMPKLVPTVKQRLPESMGGLSAADMKAIEWANANPYDPKAWEVKKRLGM